MAEAVDKRLICEFCGHVGKVSRTEDGEFFVSAVCDSWRQPLSPGCQTQRCETEEEAIKRWDRMWSYEEPCK